MTRSHISEWSGRGRVGGVGGDGGDGGDDGDDGDARRRKLMKTLVVRDRNEEQEEIKTGTRKCQRNGDFPYVNSRVCMEHARFVCTGVVKGFYPATKSTEPLWLVEFDKENENEDKTLSKVVNLRQLHRGITVSMSRDLLTSRRKLRKDRVTESLKKSAATTNFVGDHGKSITVTGTSSKVTAHLDSLMSGSFR